MRRIAFLVGLVLLLAGCRAQERKVTARWATFNLRYDNPGDSLNDWNHRKERVCQFIRTHELDVIGTQELLHHQFNDLETELPGYAGIGVGRDDGKTSGEYAAIFYRKDKFEVLDSNTFWLSEYPDSVGRKGWDAVCVRIATWAKLKEKSTGKICMAVNTHFDHIGTEARRQSALLIIGKIKEIVGGQAAVVTGDFNVNDQSDAYRTITTNEFVLKDAHKIAEKVSGIHYTFHDFDRYPMEKREKIDFIFVTPQIRVLSSEVPQEISGALLSDHNPEWVEIEF